MRQVVLLKVQAHCLSEADWGSRISTILTLVRRSSGHSGQLSSLGRRTLSHGKSRTIGQKHSAAARFKAHLTQNAFKTHVFRKVFEHVLTLDLARMLAKRSGGLRLNFILLLKQFASGIVSSNLYSIVHLLFFIVKDKYLLVLVPVSSGSWLVKHGDALRPNLNISVVQYLTRVKIPL